MGLGILVGIAFLAFWSSRGAFRWFESLEKDKAIAVIAISNIAALPILNFNASRLLERRKAIESATRAKRVEIYEQTTSYILKFIMGGNDGSAQADANLRDFLQDITPKLITHASNSVIQEWSKIRNSAGVDSKQTVLLLEDLLKAMRKDLGHSSIRLKKNALIGLFINDVA